MRQKKLFRMSTRTSGYRCPGAYRVLARKDFPGRVPSSDARGSASIKGYRADSGDRLHCLIHLLGQAPIGVVASRGGQVLYANAMLEQLTGYSREKIASAGYRFMVHPDDSAVLERADSGAAEGDVFDLRLIHRSGELVWVRIRHRRLTWQGREMLLEMITDVTSFKKTESALKRSKARLRDAQTLASLGNWEYKDGEPQHISDTLFELFRCSESERKSGFRGIWKKVYPEDREDMRRTFIPATTSTRFFDHEFRYQPAPGEVRYAHAIGVTRPAGEDGRFHSYGTMQDVTEFRWLTEQAMQAKERAEKASRSKTAFLARMSHEVRTPLNAIMGMLYMLEESRVDDVQAGFIHGARQAADGLLSVLNQVLDLAGIEAGAVALDRERFAPADLLQAIVQGFAGQAGRKNILLTHDLDPGLPRYVVTDKGRLRQILFNLVANAIKFTDRGAVSVQACMAGKGRTPGTLRLLLSVADTGTGIPWEEQDQVFNSFSRGTGSVAEGIPGTGLGLAIVRELADLFGGHISLESAPGEGTTIHFCLTVQDGGNEEEHLSQAGQNVGGAPTPSLRVLVAEDHPLNQMYAVMLLKKMGHAVDAVGSGREVLQACSETTYDIIFMDVEMPEMDGLEACARIRDGKVPGCPRNIPIVALTGHTLPEDARRFHAAGMDFHLAKPVTLEGLEQMVRSVAVVR